MSDELTYFVMRSGCEVPHKHGELSALTSRLILAGLALHADKDTGTLYVSYRGLARELDINHNTTFLAYKLYEQHGVLVRTGKRKGVGGTTEYRLNFDHLTPQNEFYKPPTDPNTQATSPQTSSPASDPASDPASCPPTDLSTQARNRNRNRNTTTDTENIEALFEQALALELEYRPTQVPLDKLKASKRQTYEQACTEVLTEYPTAQPASCPDRDLALVVCHKMNPTLPALKVSEATYTALSKHYNSKPTTTATEPPLTLDQLRNRHSLRENLRKHTKQA
jgi:hypothetical protein